MKATTHTDIDNPGDPSDVQRGLGAHDRRIGSQEVLTMVFKMSRLAGGFAGMTVLSLACGGVPIVLNFESVPFVRADDADAAAVTLTFASPYINHGFEFGTDRYFGEVEQLSNDSVRVELAGLDFAQGEQTMLDAVRDGVVDVGILGTKFFATLGVDRVAALAPPMLIDSYDLEREVFTGGLPNRLLDSFDGFEDLGVIGVAVIPGPLQKIVGVDRTFLTLDDFDGAAVGNVGFGDGVVGALGAMGGGSVRTDDSGAVSTVRGMWHSHWEQDAEAATGNLNLFALPWIVIVNPDTFASLDTDQQAAFRDAGPASVDAVIEAVVADQADALENLCLFGLEFVTTGDDDLAAIRAALDPVYADFTADPEVATYVADVEQLKAELGIGPDSVTCPEVAPSDTGNEELLPTGSYRSGEITRDELIATGLAAGFDADEVESFLDEVGVIASVEIGHRLANGTWTGTVSFDGGAEEPTYVGAYEVVDADTVLAPGPCGPITLSYAVDGDSITFDVIDDECEGIDRLVNALNFESAPFVRVAEG